MTTSVSTSTAFFGTSRLLRSRLVVERRARLLWFRSVSSISAFTAVARAVWCRPSAAILRYVLVVEMFSWPMSAWSSGSEVPRSIWAIP